MAQVQKKPPFDPSKPYEVVSEKPAFDPSKPYEIVQPEFTDVQEQPGPLKQFAIDAINSPVGQGIIKAGQFIDSYTGAPTRAAVYAAQKGENPFLAFGEQFGGDSEKAPTGKMIAEKVGASPEETLNIGDFKFSPAGAIGLGLDVALDPTNLLPAYAAVKNTGKYVTSGARMAGSAAKNVGKGALEIATQKSPALAKSLKTADQLGEVASETAKSVSKSVKNFFTPKQSEDWPRYIEIAKKNGIDPSLLTEAHEFGPNSSITNMRKTIREMPMGEARLNKFEAGRAAVQDAVENKIKAFSGGSYVDEVTAGEILRQGYNDSFNRVMENVDMTYKDVYKQVPGISLNPDSSARLVSKLDGIEKWAKGRLARGVTNTVRGQAEQVLRAIEQIRNSNGSLKQLHEAMQEIGAHAFKIERTAASDIPVDVKKFQEMYFALQGEFYETTARYLGAESAMALAQSNEQITHFLKQKAIVSSVLGSEKTAPERAFRSLVLNGDTKKIEALKEILTPEQMQQVKGALLEALIKRDPDLNLSFRQIHGAMRNKETLIKSLFTEEEIADIGELIQLGDAFGNAKASTSGTSLGNSFRDMEKSIRTGSVTEAVANILEENARTSKAALDEASKIVPTISEGNALAPVTRGRLLPARTRPEEAAKLLQILSTTNNAAEREKENATQRRLRQRIEERYRGQ